MRTIIFILSAIFIQLSFPDFSPAQTFQWVKQDGSSSTREQARKTVFDESGNMYVTGTFGGLNGGTTTIGNTLLTSHGAVDIFIAKYDNNRNLVWVKQGGSIYYDYIYGLELDDQGNIYVSGIFSSSIGNFSSPMTFGSTILIPFGREDIFIIKLNNNGNLIWAKSFGSTLDEQLNGMSKDIEGNLYITGGFRNDISFGNIALANSTGYFQNYVTKMNSNGNVLWAKKSAASNNCIGVDVASDETGNTVTTGFFSANAEFDNITLTSHGENDIMLIMYSSSGDLLWAKSFGGAQFDYGLKVDLDKNTNIFLSGSYERILNFGNNVNIQSEGGSDVFVCKFDMSGNAVWARSSGGPALNGFSSDESPSDIISDSKGNSFLTGYFSGKMVFGSDTLYQDGGSSDVYLVKYNGEGSVDLIKQIRSMTAASYVFSSTLSRNISDEIFISGSFIGDARFDDINVQSIGNFEDFYITKVSSLTSIIHPNNFSPSEFNLLQNYPNPFNPVTNLEFGISKLSFVSLKIYDMLGKEIKTLVNTNLSPGKYNIDFDASGLTSGIYFYKLQSADLTETKSMMLLK